jgi:multidrug efflux system membrane fusion protein
MSTHTGINGARRARVALSTLALLASACEPATNSFAPPPPPEVTVAHPSSRPVTRYLEYTGTTEASEEVDLRARVAGFLEQKLFKSGAAVRAGDLLFVIDRRPYQAAVNRARAQVLADEAAALAAEAEARIAEELAAQRAGSEVDRITKVGRRDAARAAVQASKAMLESAELDLGFCEVRTPIDGRITRGFVDVGNLVGAGGEATLLATVVSAVPLYVTLDASERDLMTVRKARLAASPTAEPGQVAPGTWRPVDAATADSDVFDVHGRIDYVDPALDPRTGTIRVRCRFENEDERLLPGMFVRVRIFLETADALLVPDIALMSDQSGRYALVVGTGDTVEARRVELGALDGSHRVVRSGLSAADRLVVNGLQRARPGLVVRPRLEAPQSATAAPEAGKTERSRR